MIKRGNEVDRVNRKSGANVNVILLSRGGGRVPLYEIAIESNYYGWSVGENDGGYTSYVHRSEGSFRRRNNCSNRARVP